MYNQESENVYGQESVPYEPTYTQPYPAYQSNAPYPPYSSYPPDSQTTQYPQYQQYPQHPQQPYQQEKVQRPQGAGNKPPRVTKAEALEMVSQFKQWIVIGSVVAFGLLSALAVTHVTGVTSQAASSSATPVNNGDNGPSQQFNSPSQSGSLQQQQGGYGFGNNGPAQGPVSGSSVS